MILANSANFLIPWIGVPVAINEHVPLTLRSACDS
jgi:hypothetical protein